MGKNNIRERKKNIIKEYLPLCVSCWDVYTYKNIPKNKINGACQSYAGRVDYNDIFGLIDETVFGSGKKGFLFAENGFYYDGGNKFYKYADGISFNSLNSGYNLTAMNEMLHKLYEIESEPSDWEIAGNVLSGVWDILQSLEEVCEENSQNQIVDSQIVDIDDVVEDDTDQMLCELEDSEAELKNSIVELINNAIDFITTIISGINDVITQEKDDCEDSLEVLSQCLITTINSELGEIIDGLLSEMCDNQHPDCFLKNLNLCYGKINYYLSELQTCEAEEKDDILEACKHDIKKYLKVFRSARTSLYNLMDDFA